ncbi:MULTISPECIES: GTP 3',8-cyclase MoaA [Coprobacillaceae]|uniref:GTP 3',8-cyclase MoaA n=1 Tax=Coprobacillaceae TaxID=2810280 RepID=UPI000E4BDEAE|nr:MULTISPECIES: radical SAM protein [Coprobacillaceae]RHM63606.1 radical SAM protein [Coprobacillus sp. AF33-1AC]RHS96335.1 radical SAM protein [Erysipelatoclostridium sp. AM42-17]
MKDSFQREIDYLRISITDRCYYQCSYCKVDYPSHLSHHDILSYEDLIKIVKAAIKVGITKFKITGGEPTQRKGYLYLISSLKKIKGVQSVTLTTNGSLFTKQDLNYLKNIDIDAINFSLDTLDENEYFLLTKQDCLQKVLDNILYAYHIQIPVKINCVVDDTFHLKRLQSLLSFVKDKDICLRFIEMMPLNQEKRTNHYQQIIDYCHHFQYHVVNQQLGNGPAYYIKLQGYLGYIGFIDALNHKFCFNCNRMRLTSTGQLKPCLFYNNTIDLKGFVDNEEELIRQFKKAINLKPKEHHFEEGKSLTKMNEIGG